MRIRPDIVVSALLAGAALGWAWQVYSPRASLEIHEGPITQEPSALREGELQRRAVEEQRPQVLPPLPAASNSVVMFEADYRVQFNDRAREFFARAAALPEDERQREAQQIEQQLSLLEQAGGLSAGETFLVRTGLIRETVTDPAQQAAQLKALRERYAQESSRRVAQASTRPDSAFESYKIRESQIVAEVMSLQAIPDGLTRDEYLRRRLQAAREQLMSEPAR